VKSLGAVGRRNDEGASLSRGAGGLWPLGGSCKRMFKQGHLMEAWVRHFADCLRGL
jgi:hypothetical protein